MNCILTAFKLLSQRKVYVFPLLNIYLLQWFWYYKVVLIFGRISSFLPPFLEILNGKMFEKYFCQNSLFPVFLLLRDELRLQYKDTGFNFYGGCLFVELFQDSMSSRFFKFVNLQETCYLYEFIWYQEWHPRKPVKICKIMFDSLLLAQSHSFF